VFSKEQRGGLEREKAALEQARLLLADCTLFSSLSADERSEIAARARIRSLEAGETVFAAGAPGNHMMVLLSGNIRISISSADGKELLLAIIQPGEVFGELTVLDGKVRSADAVAETPCMLAMLYRQDILSFFEKNPSAWPKLIEVLCQRLRRTNQAFAEVCAAAASGPLGPGAAARCRRAGRPCVSRDGTDSVQPAGAGEHGGGNARKREQVPSQLAAQRHCCDCRRLDHRRRPAGARKHGGADLRQPARPRRRIGERSETQHSRSGFTVRAGRRHRPRSSLLSLGRARVLMRAKRPPVGEENVGFTKRVRTWIRPTKMAPPFSVCQARLTTDARESVCRPNGAPPKACDESACCNE
jgi:CRP-like cAMP-binding protein